MKIRQVTIDTERNDSVDIRCGGPQMLGFDFKVDAKWPKSKLEKFLRATLAEFEQPVLSLYIGRPEKVITKPKKIWNEKSIRKCIKEY